MKMQWTEKTLMDFEENLKHGFEQGYIRCPLHLSGGNELNLISIFEHIKPEDYVIATHRNHYHYLLKGGDPDGLINEICGRDSGICKGKARSMNICDPSINFYSTAIVGGGCAIACGIGLGIKKDGGKSHVYCFVGDGAEDSGHFMESVRFAQGRKLPVTFIVEDNDYSTDSTKKDRWKEHSAINCPNVVRYTYKRRYPHVGIGKHIIF